MSSMSLESVITAEEQLRTAMLNSDLPQLDALLAPELLFTTHWGQIVTKEDDLAFHRSGAFCIHTLTPSQQRVILTPGAAIVSVLMHLTATRSGEPLSEHLRYTRVWRMIEGAPLQVIAGHASTATPE